MSEIKQNIPDSTFRVVRKFKNTDSSDFNWGWHNSAEGMTGISALAGKTRKELIGVAYACINKRAENVAKAEISLNKKLTDGSRQIKAGHPFLELLRKPNNRKQAFKNLLYFISVNLDLFGDAFIQIERGALNLPISFIPLFAQNISINLNDSGTQIIGYVYQDMFKRYVVPPENMLHFRLYNPDSFVKGLATCKALDYIFDINVFQIRYLKEFYENDSSFNFGLSTEKNLTKEQADKLKDNWRDKHQGYKKFNEIAIFDNNAKPVPYNGTLRDNELVKNRSQIRDEILTVFSVPKVVLAISDDVNRANAREGIRAFIDTTIFPFVDLNIHSVFDLFVQENYDEKLFTLFDYTNTENRELQLKAIETYRKYGIASVNEIREMEGLQRGIDPRDDDKYTPINGNGKTDSIPPDNNSNN